MCIKLPSYLYFSYCSCKITLPMTVQLSRFAHSVNLRSLTINSRTFYFRSFSVQFLNSSDNQPHSQIIPSVPLVRMCAFGFVNEGLSEHGEASSLHTHQQIPDSTQLHILVVSGRRSPCPGY